MKGCKQVKHKLWQQYTETEINRIKKDYCAGCKNLVGVQSFETSKNFLDPNAFADVNSKRYYIGQSWCNYADDKKRPRGCRPEICPYNQTNKKGIKLKPGEKYVLFDNKKTGCFKCKYKDLDEKSDPCAKCLKTVKRVGTSVPLYFEKEEK